MAETLFFMAAADERALVKAALLLGVRIVPSRDYETAQPVIVSSVEAFESERAQTNLFFMVSDSWLRCPIEMRQYATGPKNGKYFLMQRNGGPSIDLFCPRPEQMTGGPPSIAAGMLGYYSTFWNTATERNEAAPPELRKCFKRLVRTLSAGGIRVKKHGKTHWVCPGALEEARKGTVLVGLEKDDYLPRS